MKEILKNEIGKLVENYNEEAIDNFLHEYRGEDIESIENDINNDYITINKINNVNYIIYVDDVYSFGVNLKNANILNEEAIDNMFN